MGSPHFGPSKGPDHDCEGVRACWTWFSRVVMSSTARGHHDLEPDVGIFDGRIVMVAPEIDAGDAKALDVSGLVVCPGFVDLHTHYDAQILWDGTASPSPLHGVTTVIGGNCGFTIAPMDAEHVDYVRRMMAAVEGMPLSALEEGPSWGWTTFHEWLSVLDNRMAVNAGFLVGHSTLRRLAMGKAAVTDAATQAQIHAMVALLDQSLDGGALGFSSSHGPHLDGNGDPVPSRLANRDELVALCAVVSGHEGTTLEFIPGMGEISSEDANLMADMSLAADRPLNWNLLGNLSPVPIYAEQLTASDLAHDKGAVVVALTLPDIMRMRTDHMLEALPEWGDFLALPIEDRRRQATDRTVRAKLRAAASALSDRGLVTVESWDLVEVSPADDGSVSGVDGKTVAELAKARDIDPIDVIIDEVACRGLHLTLLFPSLEPTLGRSDAGWRARAAVWLDPRTVIGGSDAGAHLNLMCHANYTTVVLGEAVHDRRLLTLEQAIHQMTQVPAELYGLRDRGTASVGMQADLVVFDPDTVGSGPTVLRNDLPGGGGRLYAEAQGIEHVLVNGKAVVKRGAFTSERPGKVLRSGRDTYSVTL